MNPQAPVVPGTPVAPQPMTTNPQGSASITPIQGPTPTALPAAPSQLPTPGPVNAPNYDIAGMAKALGDYYNIPAQSRLASAQGQTQGNIAQSQFEAQKYQGELNIEHMKDQLDPTKYGVTKNADGSLNIINSMGQKVSLSSFSALTGSNPAEFLQQHGATDQADVKFMAAYNNLQDYVQTRVAAQSGDTQAQAKLADYYKANPGLQNLELGQLQSAFMQQYGSYFGQPQNPSKYNQLGNAPYVSPTLQSANNPLTTSPYGNNAYYAAQELNNPFAQQLGFGSLSGTWGNSTAGANGGISAQLQTLLNSQQTNNQTGL